MKIIHLIFLLFNFSIFYSQGNLQFNKIINVVNSNNLNVPANKIWKIESINFSPSVSFNTGSMQNTSCQYDAAWNNRLCYFQGVMFTIGGTIFKTPILQHLTQAMNCGSSCQATNPIALSGTTNNNNFIFPMWLKAGQNISVISGSGILISIVEFNVVP